jgi:hypothetical protein
MLNILRDPAWQGIGAIAAIVALLLYIAVERGKLALPKTKIPKRISQIMIVLSFLSGAGLALGGIALATIIAIFNQFGIIIAGLLVELLLSGGIFTWFALLSFVFFDKHLYNTKQFTILMGISMLSIAAWRLLFLGNATSNYYIEAFIFWGGIWNGGNILMMALYVDFFEKQLNGKDVTHSEKVRKSIVG